MHLSIYVYIYIYTWKHVRVHTDLSIPMCPELCQCAVEKCWAQRLKVWRLLFVDRASAPEDWKPGSLLWLGLFSSKGLLCCLETRTHEIKAMSQASASHKPQESTLILAAIGSTRVWYCGPSHAIQSMLCY